MRKIYLLLLTVFFAAVTKAQVSVTATAGTLGPTAYTNLSSAFTAINAGTHQGAITVDISASFVDVATSVLNGSGAGSASYTSVLVRPSADAVTMSFPSVTGRGVIELNGADNVTINGDNPNTGGTNRNLTIANTAANTITFTSVIRLATSTLILSTDNVSISNCNMNGSGTGRNTSSFTAEVTTWGVIVSAGASTVSVTTAPGALASATTNQAAGQTATNLTIDNNNIQVAARGISVNGAATTNFAGLLVTNNEIGNSIIGAANQVTAVGITVQGTANGIVRGNIVRLEGYIASSTPNRAINIGMTSTAGVSGVTIERNQVQRVINNNTGTWTAIGIDVAGGNNHVIQNNFVGNCLNNQVAGTGSFSTTFGAMGIRLAGGTGHKVYYNTVHFSGVIPGTISTDLVTCFAITATTLTGLDVRNNIFSNKATGGNTTLYNTVFVSIFLPSGGTSAMNLTLNNNAYYQGPTAQNGIAQVSTTGSAANLYLAANFIQGATAPATNLRAYTSTLSAAGTNDNASFAYTNPAPVYSATNLHINLSASNASEVDAKAAVIGGLATDIDNDARNGATPDIGADEFTIAPCAGAAGGTAVTTTPIICTSGNPLISASGYSTGSGSTYQWQQSNDNFGVNIVDIVGETDPAGLSGSLTISSTTYYRLKVTCPSGTSTAFSNVITITVNALPVITISPSTTQTICPGGSGVVLTASGGTTYSWTPAAGLNTTVGAVVTANPASSTTYTVTGTTSGCSNIASIAVNVQPATVVTVLPTSASVCSGTPTNLVASATPQAYGVSSIAYTPIATPGAGVTTLANGGVAITPLFTGDLDDGRWESIALPFSFSLYGTAYTAINISTNGWIAMGATNTTSTGYNTTLPAAATPNAGVYPMNSDMDSRSVGTIEYFTVGVAPNRIFVVNYIGVSFFSGGGSATVQTQLYETSNIVEFHTTLVTNTTTNKAQGIENSTGTVAHIAAGRNNTPVWTGLPDAYRFTPGSISYTWSPATGLNMTTGPSVIATPTITTIYTVTATDSGTGCPGTATSTITVTLAANTAISYPPGVFCQNNAAVPVTRSGTPGGTFSAVPVGLTIDPTTGTITPSTSTPGNYTVNFDIAAGGSCPAYNTSTPVTINAVPNVNAVANQAICVGGSTTAVNFSGTVGGTVFNWTNSQPSIGLAASGSGNIPAFVTTNATSSAIVATITVTPTYTNMAVTCTGTPITFTITVNPANAITSQPVNRTICSNQSTTFVVASTVTSPATTYQWQINQGSGFVNLAAVAPFSGVNSNTLTVTTPSTIYSGNTFQVIVTGPCGPALTSTVVTLTVNPIPNITVAPSGVCGPVTLTAQGNSNTYAWAPALGLNTTTGAVVIASPVNTTIYTVTGTFTATGCQNTATSTVLGTPPTPVITPNPTTICAGQFQALSVPVSYTSTFSSAVGTVDVPLGPSTGTAAGAPASVYPVPLVVSGLPTSGVTIKTVTVNGITHTWPQDIDMLLQSPGAGTNIILMSDVSGIFPGISGATYTFDDAAAAIPGGANAPSGTYKPTNAVGGLGNEPDNFPAPGPGVVAQPNPALSMFSGNPNGTWNLFITDDAGGDFGSIQGWSITFNVATITWTPATGLYMTPNTSQPYVLGTLANVVYASPATTTTYTATSTFGTCVSAPASVVVNVNPVPVVTVTPNNQCTPVNLTASSTITPATFAWTPAFGLSATTGASVTANPNITTTYTVTGTVTATGCQGTASAIVNATPAAPTITPSSATICQGTPVKLTATPGVGSAAGTANSGVISVAVPDGSFTGATHALNIAGIPTNAMVDSVKVNFTLTHTFDLDMIINLRAPNGNVLNLVYTEGLDGDGFTNTSITSAATTPLAAGTAPFTGTFAADRNIGPGPTGNAANVPNWSDLYSTLNGSWTLAMMDQLGGDLGVLTNWSITVYYKNAVVWTPITGLFTNPGATTAYVAGTALNEVYANPATTTTYTAGSTLGPCTGPTTNVVVTVVNTITVSTHPASQTVCANQNATFSVVSTGNFLSYQWQVSVAAGPFNDIPGATNSSLTLNAVTVGMSGNQYRVRITNSCFSATSNAATLTVNALPVVSISTVMPNKICLSDTVIALVGTPVGGVWTGIGVSNANFIPSATAVGTFTLTYSYANINNCVNTATIIAKVQDCPERIRELDNDALNLYPNPNDGAFSIKVNSQLYTQLMMNVFTTGGQLVRRTELKGLVFGRIITFDFKNLPVGTYMVEFVNVAGIRSSRKTFTVVIAKH